MPTIWEESVTKKETTVTLTTTILSLLDSKMENLSWPLLTSMVATSRTTMLPLDFQNTSVWLLLPTNGILTKLMNNANKSSKDASLFFMSEFANPLTEFNLLLSERKERLCMLPKRSSPNGISESSEKERMKSYGNDLIFMIRCISS